MARAVGEAVPLTTQAPGKVNLCLLVGAPRADGLHPLVSVVQPTDLADDVSLEPADYDEVICPGVDGPNLAFQALEAFRFATDWEITGLRLTITKRIPVAAGMAGGSSDAAAALRLAAQASGFAIPPDLPMRLGADVKVMIDAERALMTGAGEHVEPLPAPKPRLIVVPLDATLTAGEVYKAFDEHFTPRGPGELDAAAARIRETGGFEPVNDLEGPARRLCAAIDPALDALRAHGVDRPMVSGSGPTVFGFSDDPDVVARLHAAGYPRAVAA
jgi:4-diphosphocytidyl-2-C-methyl-D-erythritol kinase